MRRKNGGKTNTCINLKDIKSLYNEKCKALKKVQMTLEDVKTSQIHG
jgi:hypothetical protein